MPIGILFGQIAVVLCVALCGVLAAMQWIAVALGYQAQLGSPWFEISGIPIYLPWQLFEWWYFYDAYAPDVFLRGGTIAASSGVLATGAAIAMAVWRSRLAKRVTTYGSARWAERCRYSSGDSIVPAHDNTRLGRTSRGLNICSGYLPFLRHVSYLGNASGATVKSSVRQFVR